MESLRWAAVVFGVFGGLLMPFVALIDTSSGNFVGLGTALVLTLVTFAVCATTPGRPGYSALAYVVIFVILLGVGSVAVTAGLFLLVAALLAGVAAFFMRRKQSRAT